jgi:hypothetical protein
LLASRPQAGSQPIPTWAGNTLKCITIFRRLKMT